MWVVRSFGFFSFFFFSFFFCVGDKSNLHQKETLPPEQRWQVLERTRAMLGSEIPESFKQAMEEIARGEVIELDEALQGLDQPE